jgi:sulfatase maturation enzyme AslB (radical SAM superfamily)
MIKKENLASNGSISNWQPLYLDIRLNNICNLKCRMCSGYFSSSIAQEEVELFDKTFSIESALKIDQRNHNLNDIIKYVPYAEKIYFAGGEPLLTSEHYAILDALIECDNKNLEITYNTNFTTLIYKDRNVLDLWKKFSNITIGASLDAQGPVAEYVRHGTKWTIIESNLELLKSQCPHVNFTVTSTVGLLNLTSLIDLQRSWHQENKLDISKFSMSVLLSPDHLSLTSLPHWHKTRLEKHINGHVEWCKSIGAIKLANQWEDVLSYMWSKDSSHAMMEFQRLTKIMDKHRNQSLTVVLPEYQDLI